MPGPTSIVVVTGPPAAGKSTVAEALSEGLLLPLIAKDRVKEVLFDALGAPDVQWSKRLGRAVYPLLFQALDAQLRPGCSCIVEANFDHDAASAELARLQARTPFRALQIVCTAPAELLLERYAARTGRHPGHFDELRVDDVREAIAAGRWRALDLAGETWELDTSEPLDLTALVDRARAWLHPASAAPPAGRSGPESQRFRREGSARRRARRRGEP